MLHDCREAGHIQKKCFCCSDRTEILHDSMIGHSKATDWKKELHISNGISAFRWRTTAQFGILHPKCSLRQPCILFSSAPSFSAIVPPMGMVQAAALLMPQCYYPICQQRWHYLNTSILKLNAANRLNILDFWSSTKRFEFTFDRKARPFISGPIHN